MLDHPQRIDRIPKVALMATRLHPRGTDGSVVSDDICLQLPCAQCLQQPQCMVPFCSFLHSRDAGVVNDPEPRPWWIRRNNINGDVGGKNEFPPSLISKHKLDMSCALAFTGTP